MSELRPVIEVLRAEVLSKLPDARLEEDFCELHRACEQLEAERLRRLAELERRGTFARDGHLSAASWLADRLKVAWAAAREHVRTARALQEMPETRRALEGGEVSLSAVKVLAQAREADPEAFGQSEPQLVEAARIHSTQDLGKVAAYWRQAVEGERAVDAEERIRARRRLHATVTFLGMVRVDGDLDAETGETLLTALRAVVDAEARSPGADGEERTPAQRRADALGEICRQWLDLAERPRVGGERPHLTVTVDSAALAAGASSDASVERPGHLHRGESHLVDRATTAASEMDHVGPVDPSVPRRLGCDASIMRVVMAGPSEPLDVGRRTPVVPPAMRRAVIARDRGCRFPGCDRPHPWCDAHHVIHWAEGGLTALPNLVLLCRRHHRMVHRPGGFRLEMEGARSVFRRPDGSVLDGSAMETTVVGGSVGGDRAPP